MTARIAASPILAATCPPTSASARTSWFGPFAPWASTFNSVLHEDMTRAFEKYPKAWGLPRPDASIDHRRVPNLQTYFRRRGVEAPATSDARDYMAGDLVTWMLPGNLPHIGIVTDRRSADGQRPLIVHNIGNGPELEDMLLRFSITGHYRYRGE
jgi:hypothetical protein